MHFSNDFDAQGNEQQELGNTKDDNMERKLFMYKNGMMTHLNQR